MSFFKELKQRSVFKVALVYLVSAWVLMQIADVMFPALRLPEWSITLVAIFLILGFPIALLLAWAFELTPDGIRRDGATAAAPEQPAKQLSGAEADAGQRKKSIAVLPFADLSANHDNEYFSDGLTEELLNVLSKTDGLRVSSRTSCFAFKGKDLDIPAAAERLKVGHVLEGSVRKAGEQVRVTAQLIEVATDSRLWGESYDRELHDIFTIQDDIAQKIVNALRLTLDPKELNRQTTDSAKAYDYYLRGRSFFHKFGPKSMNFAIEMFTHATRIDPEFARAWSGLSDAHAVIVTYYSGGKDAAAAADAASNEAIRIAPDIAETHVSRGIAHLACQRLEEAAASFEQAIAIDPNIWESYYFYARTLVHWNRIPEALEYFDKAAKVDPEDYQGPLIAGSIHRGIGETVKAEEAERRGIRLAEKHLENYPDSARAYCLATSAIYNCGDKKKALEWAERALAIDPDDLSMQYNLACFYSQVGEADLAFEFLENSIRSSAWLENDVELDPIRDDPRFAALIEKLNSKQVT